MFGIVELLMSVWILVACQISDETTLLLKAPGTNFDTWGVQVECLWKSAENKGNNNHVKFSCYYCLIHNKEEPNGAGTGRYSISRRRIAYC